MNPTPHRSLLRHLTRTDPDPRVRHRADALLLEAGGLSLSQAAHQIGCCRNSVHTWAERFLAEGATAWSTGGASAGRTSWMPLPAR